MFTWMGNATATASSRKGAKDSQERQLRVGLNGNCNCNGASRKGAKDAKDRKERQLQRRVGVNGNCYGDCNGASRQVAKAQRTAKNGNCGLGLTATATATAPLAKAPRTQRTTKNGNCYGGLGLTATATAPLALRLRSGEAPTQRRKGPQRTATATAGWGERQLQLQLLRRLSPFDCAQGRRRRKGPPRTATAGWVRFEISGAARRGAPGAGLQGVHYRGCGGEKPGTRVGIRGRKGTNREGGIAVGWGAGRAGRAVQGPVADNLRMLVSAGNSCEGLHDWNESYS
jgi:bacterioferritin-associated ferredoxin